MIPTVAQKLNMPNHKLKAGALGVEVEVEGENLPNFDNDDWRTEIDHSLRGESNEYVMREPRSLDETVTCLNNLKEALSNSAYYETPRAGVHVHVNVQELNVVHMYNLILSTYLLETILTRYCGAYREGNLFCLRVCDADYQAKVLEESIVKGSLRPLASSMIRYSALNLNSLSKYGSLEYRAMRSTADFEVLKVWCNVLYNMREQAQTFESPLDVVSMALEAPESFVYKMLGDCAGELLNDVNIVAELEVGLEYALPIAHAVDWNSFNEQVIGGLSFPSNIEWPDEPMEDF